MRTARRSLEEAVAVTTCKAGRRAREREEEGFEIAGRQGERERKGERGKGEREKGREGQRRGREKGREKESGRGERGKGREKDREVEREREGKKER